MNTSTYVNASLQPPLIINSHVQCRVKQFASDVYSPGPKSHMRDGVKFAYTLLSENPIKLKLLDKVVV